MKSVRASERYFDVGELAQMYGKTKAAVYKWVDAGCLPATFITSPTGRRTGIRVTPNDANMMKRILDLNLPPSAARLECMKKLANG